MSTEDRPLIAGAGPVGLAAALFLAHQGLKTKIIDSSSSPSPQSKALAVNPRTLEILEPVGITDEMLASGKRILGAQMWHKGQIVAEIAINQLHHKYPFMLALSQAATVRMLEAALNRHGIAVEWGVELTCCRNSKRGVEAGLRRTGDGAIEVADYPWLLAADGARSTVRRELGIPFDGSDLPNQFYLLDLPLETSLPQDRATTFFLDGGGFVFLFRVVDGPEAEPRQPALWRVIGSMPDPLRGLDAVRPAGPPVWESSFHIAHRINRTLSQGNVYFAGDAAHIHSPVGARGMNLGIEDAWVFSQMLRENRLADYGAVRRKVDRRVVRRVELLTRLLTGESPLARLLRTTAVPVMARVPLLRNRMILTLTGLDHPLAELAPQSPSFAA
jgi:2-polyprenyl-6-methoxyphenol hydroxylase-like FAD-dependent oxidoreductase